MKPGDVGVRFPPTPCREKKKKETGSISGCWAKEKRKEAGK